MLSFFFFQKLLEILIIISKSPLKNEPKPFSSQFITYLIAHHIQLSRIWWLNTLQIMQQWRILRPWWSMMLVLRTILRSYRQSLFLPYRILHPLEIIFSQAILIFYQRAMHWLADAKRNRTIEFVVFTKIMQLPLELWLVVLSTKILSVLRLKFGLFELEELLWRFWG